MSPSEAMSWSEMILKSVDNVNPIEVEDAVVDLASGKYPYNVHEGVKCLINAIQMNRGQNWYYDPNK